MKIAVWILAACVLTGRALIVPRLTHIPTIELSYETFAHLFVGFLIIVPWYDRKQVLGPSKLYGWIGWSLSIWELVWFLAQKFKLI